MAINQEEELPSESNNHQSLPNLTMLMIRFVTAIMRPHAQSAELWRPESRSTGFAIQTETRVTELSGLSLWCDECQESANFFFFYFWLIYQYTETKEKRICDALWFKTSRTLTLMDRLSQNNIDWELQAWRDRWRRGVGGGQEPLG